MKQPISGYSNLYKDTESGVIINRESTDRERYRIAKQQALLNMSSQYEIQSLRQEIDEIKSLLTQLLNK